MNEKRSTRNAKQKGAFQWDDFSDGSPSTVPATAATAAAGVTRSGLPSRTGGGPSDATAAARSVVADKKRREMKMCASCRNGENEVPADFEVKGRTFRFTEGGLPYHAFLCEDHFNMMLEDGDELEVIRCLSTEGDE